MKSRCTSGIEKDIDECFVLTRRLPLKKLWKCASVISILITVVSLCLAYIYREEWKKEEAIYKQLLEQRIQLTLRNRNTGQQHFAHSIHIEQKPGKARLRFLYMMDLQDTLERSTGCVHVANVPSSPATAVTLYSSRAGN